MNRKFYFIVFLILKIGITSTLVAQDNLKVKVQNQNNAYSQIMQKRKKMCFDNPLFKPQTVSTFVLYENDWSQVLTRENSYNTDSLLVASHEQSYPDQTNSFKDTLVYDDQGRLTQKTTFIWNGAEWQDYQRRTIHYGDNGFISEDLLEDVLGNDWDTTMYDCFAYEDGRLTTYSNITNFYYMWMEVRIDFVYDDDGNLLEIINSMTDDTGEIVYLQKLTNIVFYSYVGNYIDDKIEYADFSIYDNGWFPFGRLTATYDEYGGYIKLYEAQEDEVYYEYQKETLVVDEHFNVLESKSEYKFDNLWLIESGEKFDLTYNGDQLTERVFYYWYQKENEYVAEKKEVYGNYLSLGKDLNQDQLDFFVYPNPASDYINMVITNPKHYYSDVFICNQQGQMVKSFNIRNIDKMSLDVSGLPAGYYFFKYEDSIFPTYFIKTGR